MVRRKQFIYQNSADMRDLGGMFQAGAYYRDRFRVEKNESKTFIYFQMSVMMDYVFIANMAGHKTENDKYKAFIYFQRSIEIKFGAIFLFSLSPKQPGIKNLLKQLLIKNMRKRKLKEKI
ncbi:hypothetical protein C2G38_2033608 [Gigaspora rosea]|uniref:Uncharacterized protein n=1 Tax=Gigaspora rosea TaxID=44941 RepID=A0A397VKL9_9GLOM|nr:hypothetical protein C2G38_2033608 [Gigaspora rosea]